MTTTSSIFGYDEVGQHIVEQVNDDVHVHIERAMEEHAHTHIIDVYVITLAYLPYLRMRLIKTL